MLPEILILKPNKFKSTAQYIALAGISGLFVAIGIWMISDGEVMGWLIAGFFALGIPVSLFMIISTLFLDTNYLQLTPDGFEVNMGLKVHFTKWDEVTEFFPIQMNRSVYVAYNFTERYTKMESARKLSKSMTGVEAMFMESYGKSTKELADLLNEWRVDYSQQSQTEKLHPAQ
jgi:hypothetical protein